MTKANKAATLPPLKRETAKARFLSMGESRSLARVRALLLEEGKYRVPGLNSFKEWSRHQGWQAKAKEHDAQVSAATSSKAIELEADQRVELSSKLRRFSSEAIDKALAMLTKVQAASVDEIETLVKASVDASKQAEVLDAGTGANSGNGPEDEALAAMRDGGEHFLAHVVKLAGGKAVH